MAIAYFSAGCFWGIEVVFRHVPGVLDARVGYMGGSTENPIYRQVCTGNTGHAETLQVQYDPSQVSYETLLELFWKIHDPTTLNRQGPDIGTQYRSVIFTTTPEQHRLAIQSKQQLADSKRFSRPVVTEILPAPNFYPAEEYHQRYLEKRGRADDGCHL